MNIEYKGNLNENFEGNKEIIEEALVSDNFIVYCDSNIKEYIESTDAEKMDDVKKFIDDILKAEWGIKEQKIKAYLFSNEEEYLKFLNKNFPDSPKDMASFDQKTNSVFAYSPVDIEKYEKFLGEGSLTNEDIENTIRGDVFSGVGHEFSHLHHPFNGVGNNEDLDSKWEQEMVCIFIEDKIRSGFDKKFNKNIKLQARRYLKNLQNDNKTFSWEETSNNWDNFTLAERFVYPWLEEKFGLEKLQDLWAKIFIDKKTITEAVKEIYNRDINVLESNFQSEMLKE